MNAPDKREDAARGAQPGALRNTVEWAIIVVGFVVGTLLWIPGTRPDFMKPKVEPGEVAVQAAPAPKPRPTGKLRVLYKVNPPMHADDVAKLERAKEYMEMKYGLENPVEIGIQPQSLEVCRTRSDGVINDEVVRCRSGYKVIVTLTRKEE